MQNYIDTFYRYADTADVYNNDIVMSNENAHRFFRRLGIKLHPLDVAYYVGILDEQNLGYVTLHSIEKLWDLAGNQSGPRKWT